MTAPVRRVPTAGLQRSAGASFRTEAGWEIPEEFGEVEAEVERLRESVALVDVTPRGKVDVRGELDEVLASAGDAISARVGRACALVLAQPGEEEILLPKLVAAAGPTTMVTDATHLFAGMAFAGPALEEALALLTSWDPATLEPGAATGAPIAEVWAVLVRRDLELPILEAYVATEFARYAWEVAVNAVRRVGGGSAGWAALRGEGWS